MTCRGREKKEFFSRRFEIGEEGLVTCRGREKNEFFCRRYEIGEEGLLPRYLISPKEK
jgi:hypothetical protein